jgi:hypothetical protein
MIAQGSDGLSRGDHLVGGMQGLIITHFVPLHLTALDWSLQLSGWPTTLVPSLSFIFLDPKSWYTTRHSFGNIIWCPPPAAAVVVVKQLGKARHNVLPDFTLSSFLV